MTSRTSVCAAVIATVLCGTLLAASTDVALAQEAAPAISPAAQTVMDAIATAQAAIASQGLTGDEAAATLAAAINDALPADATADEVAAIMAEVKTALKALYPDGVPASLSAAVAAVIADRAEAGGAPGAGGPDGGRPSVPATAPPSPGGSGDDDALPDYNPA